MVAPIKQIVTIGPEGKIEIPRSGLPPGTEAEVTVVPRVVENREATQKDQFLEALDKLQKMMNLDEAAAKKWMEENNELRKGFGRRLDSLGY